MNWEITIFLWNKSNIALFSHVFHIFYAKINKIRKDPTILVRIQIGTVTMENSMEIPLKQKEN